MTGQIDFEKLFGEGAKPPEPRAPGRRLVLAALIIAALVVSLRLVDLYSDWLWFAALDQISVVRTQVLAPLAMLLVTLAVGLAWLAGNWLLAVRRASGQVVWPGQRSPVPGDTMRTVAVAAAAVVSFLIALGVSSAWPTVMLYLNGGDFGATDPILGRDVGFYVFDLPMYELARGVLLSHVFVALIGVALIYAAGGLLQIRERTLEVPAGARTHLTVLAALWALLWAAGSWLSRFELLLTSRDGGAFFGPGYADITVLLPGLTLLALLGVVLAGLLLLTLRVGRPWLPLGAIALAVVVRFVAVDMAPGLVQRYRVRPDELRLESPYIEHAIAGTRAAYALEDVAEMEYDPSGQLSEELVDDNRGTFENLRLWDWQVLLGMFEQIQEIRTYYRFLDVDLDRYLLDGAQHQVNLAARELDVEELRNPTWVNRHLEFTHGFGAVVAPVDEVDSRGQAVLWAKDIPTVTEEPFDVSITQPRIYFGEAQDDTYVIVGTDAQEFDYPAGSNNVRNDYDGAAGVKVGSTLRQMAFAARFGDVEILLSDAVTPDSRILMYRNITDRVRRLAPFLLLDPDPYLVITSEGRLVWIYDAYTATDRYPYSQPVPGWGQDLRTLAGQNYARNSVKVVIDAYDGVPRFFVVDEADPILAAWRRTFPTLFEADGARSEAFREHWRYPEALFRAQAEIYTRYHMSRADVFYNAEDVWSVPLETRQQGEKVPVQPYYVTMRLRGEPEPEFLLMLPFTPVEKQVMISWLAARSDPAHYGELVVYRFEKGRRIDGPEIVEDRIDKDTDVSAQLTLWSQAGSRTIRGNLLVIPLGDAVMYVEPLYLAAEASSFPELKRVIVASQDDVVMEKTLDEAMAEILSRTELRARAGGAGESGAVGAEGTAGTEGRASTAGDAEGAIATPSGSPPGEPAGSGSASGVGPAIGGTAAGDLAVVTSVPDLVTRAREHQDAARAALRDGDWAAFGLQMAALEDVIERLTELVGPEEVTTTLEAAP
ncbi:MAG: UPF0182 family protein [Anaerolineae bacterium]